MKAAADIIQRSVDGLIPVENYITVPIRCLSASCTAMSPLTNQVLNTECDRTAFVHFITFFAQQTSLIFRSLFIKLHN